mmetsp:Transcript_7054/g.10120  ORF Transcript_7054/g.10120 Transcript_7054/m.10120 type:complete len:87 (-) Transcript_7054:235-495(-)
MMSDKEDKDKPTTPSENLANCILSQYQFCAAGVGLGAAYGMGQKRGIAPMIVSGVAGSIADLIYGYTIACQNEVRAFHDQESQRGT